MQAIERPFGVSVYGSAILRTEPDVAEIEMGVGRVAQKASDAFQATQKGKTAVRRSLQKSGLKDDLIEVARVSLESAYQGFGENRKFIGYKAYVKFRLVVKDLDRLEQLLSDAVEAGANEVQSVSYQASRLRELRWRRAAWQSKLPEQRLTSTPRPQGPESGRFCTSRT